MALSTLMRVFIISEMWVIGYCWVGHTTNVETTSIIQEELERFISTHLLLNQSFNIDYRWSGIMGFTEDKQPMIKHISDKITAIIACNGMGVALSPVISEQL